MSTSETEILGSEIQKRWPDPPSEKAKRYIGQFQNPIQIGARIVGDVEGNHGLYTVSIWMHEHTVNSACSCYIGKHGYCHHCAALAHTFVHHIQEFPIIQSKRLEEVETLDDLASYLSGHTLEHFLSLLKAQGISQKAFAEGLGTTSRHISAMKSSELRNRFHRELGATKVACLWVIEHFAGSKSSKKKPKKKKK